MATAVQGTQSFARSISLLRHIAERHQPPTLAELLSECGVTRPSLYRMLAALEAEGLIVKTARNQYLPGPELISLARKALDGQDLRALARPHLEDLRNATGETVHLAVRNGDEMVYIDKIDSPQSVRMASTIGTRVAFHSTGVGKAFLAALPNEEADRLMQSLKLHAVTQHTATKLAELWERVGHAQAQGYVFDDQENELGIVCYGAAILQAPDKPAACISVSVPLYRHAAEPRHYSDPLIACTSAISRLLGHSTAV